MIETFFWCTDKASPTYLAGIHMFLLCRQGNTMYKVLITLIDNIVTREYCGNVVNPFHKICCTERCNIILLGSFR